MTQQPKRNLNSTSHTTQAKITPLRRSRVSLNHINSFGALLRHLRHSENIRQREIINTIPEYCTLYSAPHITRDMYINLENGKRVPQYEELLPLYATIVGCGVQITPEERHAYVNLAQGKIEAQKRKRQKTREELEWQELEFKLAEVDETLFKRSQKETEDSQEPKIELELVGSLKPILDLDLRHVVGRESWIEEMLSHLQGDIPKKLVVVQACIGTGKTSALNLFLRKLLEIPSKQFYPISYTCSTSATTMTPEDHLDHFLAILLRELGIAQSESPKAVEREMQINMLLSALTMVDQRVIIKIDNGEAILDSNGQISPYWQEFFTKFLQYQHYATVYLATREWPLWPSREHSYLVETTMPPLEADACIKIWRRQGFNEATDEMLSKASIRYGGNPLMVELRASTLRQRLSFAFSWEDSEILSIPDQNEEDTLLQELLDEPRTIDSATDIEARILQQVISRHLSQDAEQLLRVLASATIPLAFPLLIKINRNAPHALWELQRASLLDAYALSSKRARVLPIAAEAIMQSISDETQKEAETQIINLYDEWLRKGNIRHIEAGALIAECTVLLLKHQHVLEAAELLIKHGWISFNTGHGVRLARLALDAAQRIDPTSLSNSCGAVLLTHYLMPFLGKKINDQKRAEDYQQIYSTLIANSISIQPSTEIHIIHIIMLKMMNDLKFENAEQQLENCMERLERSSQASIDVKTALLEKQAWFLGKKSAHIKEGGDQEAADKLQEENIATYKQGVQLLSQEFFQISPLEQSLLKKRLSLFLTNLAYRLNISGRQEEALEIIEKSIELKQQGHGALGSLAAAYGEKSQILSELGRYREARIYDEKALTEVERLARTGHTLSQEEVWIYRVNHAILLLRLGKIDEAEKLLREASPKIHPRRRVYQVAAEEAIEEIKQWRQWHVKHMPTSHQYQLDWRWLLRYREAVAYDSYWWWSAAGPFTHDEKQQWDNLYPKDHTEETKEQLGRIIAQSRLRELEISKLECREPLFWYPALNPDTIQSRIDILQQLSVEIRQKEPSALVRDIYLDTINSDITYLRLINSTHTKDNRLFQELSNILYPQPTVEEMQYPLQQVILSIAQGLQQAETKEMSQRLLQFITNTLQLSLDIPSDSISSPLIEASSSAQTMISPLAAKKCFNHILQEHGYSGWQVITDPKATGPRVEPSLRQLFIQAIPTPISKIEHYLAHEIAGHVARSVAGEKSLIGLLAIGTSNYLYTEEGLALYLEKKAMKATGETFDDSGAWLGMLAIGLARGVIAPPQSFQSLLTFFEQLLLIRRILKKIDRDLETAQLQAQKAAVARCLRTFRGVPDLNEPGCCFTKDTVYLRGLGMLETAAKQDTTIIEKLTVGKFALEQLKSIQELDMSLSIQSLENTVTNPNLSSYIASFEN